MDLPATKFRVSQKDPERLIVKICSMLFAVPGTVEHLYHIPHALTQGEKFRAWIYMAFQ